MVSVRAIDVLYYSLLALALLFFYLVKHSKIDSNLTSECKKCLITRKFYKI